eukprot:TRINITY_DN81099_c0_g1_i1.p1 TRINITY_DN81099_c0_g1~~TRINITY_DN81099_c0_g1_i1.p1  ORF type:complete len:320 (+),score=76.51 TRINITY_DN81099_c0_g1_i1:71-1030(+)
MANGAIDRSGRRWFAPAPKADRCGVATYIGSAGGGLSNPPQSERVRADLLAYMAENGIAPPEAPPPQPRSWRPAASGCRSRADSDAPSEEHTPKAKRRGMQASLSLPAIGNVNNRKNGNDRNAKGAQGRQLLKGSGAQSSSLPAIQDLTGSVKSKASPKGHGGSEVRQPKKCPWKTSLMDKSLSDNEFSELKMSLQRRSKAHRLQVIDRSHTVQTGEEPSPWQNDLVDLQSKHNRKMRSIKPGNLRDVSPAPPLPRGDVAVAAAMTRGSPSPSELQGTLQQNASSLAEPAFAAEFKAIFRSDFAKSAAKVAAMHADRER